MAFTGIDHVQLAIPDGGEDRARAFFTGPLGFSEVRKPDNLSKTGCWFESGSVKVHIGVDADFHPAAKAHPALMTDDLGALRKRLEEAGYATHDDNPVKGFDRFFTFDPFGNRIEFMQKI